MVRVYRVMVLNATFYNISVISWRSVLLVEETGVSRENHHPVASGAVAIIRQSDSPTVR